jgi:hypothetical protein
MAKKQKPEKPRWIQGREDRTHDLSAEAYVFGVGPSSDAADYELRDVKNSPVGGHQEEVPKDS